MKPPLSQRKTFTEKMNDFVKIKHQKKIGVDSLKNLRKIKTGGRNMSKISGINTNHLEKMTSTNKKQVMLNRNQKLIYQLRLTHHFALDVAVVKQLHQMYLPWTKQLQ